MHANVPVRFGRGRLDSLATKGLAAYLIAGHFDLRAHVDPTEARNAKNRMTLAWRSEAGSVTNLLVACTPPRSAADLHQEILDLHRGCRFDAQGSRASLGTFKVLQNLAEELEQCLRRLVARRAQIVIDRRVVLPFGGMDSRGDLCIVQGLEQPL